MIKYLLVLTFQKILLLFSHTQRVFLFSFIAKLAKKLLKQRTADIKTNLTHVYKDITKEEMEDISQACYKYAAFNVLTLLEAGSYDKADILSKTTFYNRHYIDELLAKKKPIIIVTAHYGNIELLGYLLAKVFTPMVQVQRKLDNDPKLTEFMKAQRENHGMKIVERNGAVRALVKALKQKKVISLVVDQHVNPKVGSKIKFLGKDAYQTNTPAYLARKFDAAILPVFMHYKDDFHYEVMFEKPIYVEKTDDEQSDILQATQKQADLISKLINNDPSQWFWCHKRFKIKGEKIYA